MGWYVCKILIVPGVDDLLCAFFSVSAVDYTFVSLYNVIGAFFVINGRYLKSFVEGVVYAYIVSQEL